MTDISNFSQFQASGKMLVKEQSYLELINTMIPEKEKLVKNLN